MCLHGPLNFWYIRYYHDSTCLCWSVELIHLSIPSLCQTVWDNVEIDTEARGVLEYLYILSPISLFR